MTENTGSMASATTKAIDPITVEVVGSALSSISEEMGEALVRASYSTNIKERRDCSTALFDIHGNTLCQAEHIPMHLGSFIGIIPHIMKRHPVAGMQPGDVFVGNDAVLTGDVKVYPFKTIEDGAVVNSSIVWESKGARSLFGRDGVKGLANVDVTPELAVRVAMAYGTALRKGTTVVTSRDSSRASAAIVPGFAPIRGLKLIAEIPTFAAGTNLPAAAGGNQADTYGEFNTVPGVLDMITLDPGFLAGRIKVARMGDYDADLVLVDTAGRSVSEAVARQAEMLRAVEGMQLYLVVSAGTGSREMAAAAERYRPMAPERLIVTKVDEAVGTGSLLSASVRIGRPIVAVSDGQRVPEDIHSLNSTELVDLIVGTPTAESTVKAGGR